jgi:phosphate-selective porin OprO and OprP
MIVRSRKALRVALAAALLALPDVAAAQSAPPPPAQAPAPPPVTAGWSDGFFIQSAAGDHRLVFGVVLQADGRFSLEDDSPIVDTFVLRKARPIFSGRVARYFDFKLMPELTGGTAVLLDGYFDIRISTKFRLRSGKDKTPVGYELLLGDTTLLFPERSVVSALVPNRDVGFAAHGELAGGKVIYGGGIFNGNTLDGASNTTDVDVNDGKDLAGRVVFQPFRSGSLPASRWSNLGFHLGASTGNQAGPMPSFRTSVGQTFFSHTTTVLADGRRTRITPAVFLYLSSFGAFAEYARSSSEVNAGQRAATIDNHAWGITASYVLTGEPTSDRGVRPRAPFDPAAGEWGALQVLGRYAEITFDDDVFAAGLAASGASRGATQLSLGLNWYLNHLVKVYGTYERFAFDAGSRADEHVIVVRSQLAF